MLPPGVPPSWDDIPEEATDIQSNVLMYHQIREHEENELLSIMLKAGVMRML